MDPQNANPVLAQVILRNPAGPSLAAPAEPITADNVSQYYSPDAIQATAIQRLQAQGFDVVQRSPLGLTIQGSKPLFERTFHTQLVWQGEPTADPTASADDSAALPDRPAAPDATPVPGATRQGAATPPARAGAEMPLPDRESSGGGGWTAARPLVLPASLRDVVEQVVLPTPMSYY